MALLDQGEVSVRIFNYAGQEVLAHHYDWVESKTIGINTGHLPSGIYVCQISTPAGTYSEKIVIAN
jgi:hypothetical protein